MTPEEELALRAAMGQVPDVVADSVVAEVPALVAVAPAQRAPVTDKFVPDIEREQAAEIAARPTAGQLTQQEGQKYSRAAMLLNRRGGAGGAGGDVKGEIATTTDVEPGTMSDQAQAQYADARAFELANTLVQRQAQNQLAGQTAQVQLRADKAVEQKYHQLGLERNAYLQQAKTIRDNMDATSNEIAAMKPAQEGLYAGLDGENSIIMTLGLAMQAIGAGLRARGGDMSGAEQAFQTIRELSGRAVRAQKRDIELKQGKINAQGTILERHLANLGDMELATRAAEADIARRTAIIAKEQAAKFAPVIGAAEANILAARAEQEALVAQANLRKSYGAKVKETLSTKFSGPRRALQAQARGAVGPAAIQAAGLPALAPPLAAPPSPGAYQDPNSYFSALAGAQPAAPLSPDVALATGQPLPQAPAQPQAPRVAQAAPRGPVSAPPPPPAGEPVPTWVSLMMAGKEDQAVAAMPDDVAANFKKDLKFRMGSADIKGDVNAGMASVFNDWKGQYSEHAPVPAEVREREVHTGGEKYLAPTAERAKDVQKALKTNDNLLGSLHKMRRLVAQVGDGPVKAVPPEIRSQIDALGSNIAAQLSQSAEMGVIQSWDMDIWDRQSGKLAANWFNNPLNKISAGVDTAIAEVYRRRDSVMQDLQPANPNQVAKPREVK